MAKAGEDHNLELNEDHLSPEEIAALEDTDEETPEEIAAAAKKIEEDAAAKKVEDDAAAAKAIEDADAKKLADDAAAAKKIEDDAAAAKIKEDEGKTPEVIAEEAAKKLEEETIAPEAKTEQATFATKLATDPERVKIIDTTLTEVEKNIDTLVEQLENSDIEFKEYHKKFNALNDQKSDLKLERHDLVRADEQNTMTDHQLWEHDQNTFFGQKVNSSLVNIAPIREAMNQAVIKLANDKSMVGKSGSEVLEAAKKNVLGDAELAKKVKDDLGIDVTTLPAWGTAVEKIKHPAKKPTVPDVGPVTLEGLSSAGEMDGDGEETDTEFAELDRLIDEGTSESTIEYESIIASMPIQRQKAYLNVGHAGAKK